MNPNNRMIAAISLAVNNYGHDAMYVTIESEGVDVIFGQRPARGRGQ